MDRQIKDAIVNITSGFLWEKTKEGKEYWEIVIKKLGRILEKGE